MVTDSVQFFIQFCEKIFLIGGNIANRYRCHMTFILFCIAFPVSHAEQTVPNFVAHYNLTKGPLVIGKTIRSLTSIDNDRYLFESVTIPKGVATMFTDGKITEQSIWTYRKQSVRPLEYSYKNTTSKTKREIKLVFDWQASSVTNIINGTPWKMELLAGTQDKLVYQLRIMLDLNKKRDNYEYLVADGGKIKKYQIKIVSEEDVETPLGKFHSIIVSITGKYRTTKLWCAPELKFLPVKIEQNNPDESSVYAVLFKLEGINIPTEVKPKNIPNNLEESNTSFE